MTCEKTTYDSFLDAKKKLNSFHKGRHNNRKLATKKPKRVYKCEICGKYHLTSLNKKYEKRKIQGDSLFIR